MYVCTYVCICIRHEAHMNGRKQTDRQTDRQTNKQTYFNEYLMMFRQVFIVYNKKLRLLQDVRRRKWHNFPVHRIDRRQVIT